MPYAIKNTRFQVRIKYWPTKYLNFSFLFRSALAILEQALKLYSTFHKNLKQLCYFFLYMDAYSFTKTIIHKNNDTKKYRTQGSIFSIILIDIIKEKGT